MTEIKNKQTPDILMVEDDYFLRDILTRHLEQEKFTVVQAYTGNSALETLQKTTPRLVLLDLLLPDIDGFEIMEKMRGNPKWSKIPILVMSNLGDEKSIKRACALGAKEYIVKAHHIPKDIIKIIRRLLEEYTE